MCKEIVENKVVEESKESEGKQLVLAVGLHDMWFEDIAYFLAYGECLEGLTTRQRRDLRLMATKYVILDGKLLKKSIDGTFLRRVDK